MAFSVIDRNSGHRNRHQQLDCRLASETVVLFKDGNSGKLADKRLSVGGHYEKLATYIIDLTFALGRTNDQFFISRVWNELEPETVIKCMSLLPSETSSYSNTGVSRLT